MTYQEMLNLKLGDIVCDCTFNHQKVVHIHEEKWPDVPKWFNRWAPISIYLAIYFSMEWLGLSTVHDKMLILEDGRHCSAINCAHLVPHEENLHDYFEEEG